MNSQQPPGQPPWRQPSLRPVSPAPRKRHILRNVLLAVAGVLVLIVALSVAFAPRSKPAGGTAATPPATAAPAATAAATPSPTPASPGIGDPVRDGKFQFTVTSVSQAQSVGSSLLGKAAQGEYTILHVTVTNIGSVGQTLEDTAQYVYDSAGRKFDADTEADAYANSDPMAVFVNDINPGNTVHAEIAFDMPKGDRAVTAELHDSIFSGGVTVRL